MADLDMRTGQLGQAVRVSNAVSAAFLALHPDGRHIYSTGESKGTVNAFSLSEADGTLTIINTQPSGGTGPCYVSIDPAGKNLLVANYSGGSCSVLPIQPDGSLAPPSSVQQHTGSSVHPKRQTKAYTHSINCDPAGRFAMAVDLGMDKIMIYRFDAASGTLTPNDPPFTATEPGGGPRHFTFHPSGKFAYANLEIVNKVVAFRYDANKGTLTEIQSIATIPVGFDETKTTSEILTSPDGRFLYVGNRGDDSLTIFAIDAATGKLTLLGRESTRGKIPRAFRIDPTGTYLIAANQNSGNVTVFRINRKTGQLEFTGSTIEVPSPTCVQFIAAP